MQPLPRRTDLVWISNVANTEQQIDFKIETSAQVYQLFNEEPEKSNLATSHMEPTRTTSDHESVYEPNETPLLTDRKSGTA